MNIRAVLAANYFQAGRARRQEKNETLYGQMLFAEREALAQSFDEVYIDVFGVFGFQ